MRRRCSVVGTVVAVLLAFGVSEAAAGYCYNYAYFYNTNRRVYGAVNAECGTAGGDSPWHSIPTGNWGVESNFTRRVDWFQFPGWYPDDDWLQWNSCTTLLAEFRAPTEDWYNDPDGRVDEAEG